MLGGYALRTVLRAELSRGPSAQSLATSAALPVGEFPTLDVVVAARDEEAVVARLVERLTALRYPADRLSTWVIDDGSLDLIGPLPSLMLLLRITQA